MSEVRFLVTRSLYASDSIPVTIFVPFSENPFCFSPLSEGSLTLSSSQQAFPFSMSYHVTQLLQGSDTIIMSISFSMMVASTSSRNQFRISNSYIDSLDFSRDILVTSIVSKQNGSRTKSGNESTSPNSTIVIIGAILGFLLLLCIVGVLIIIIFRHRNYSDECNHEPEAEMEPEMDFSMTIEMTSSCNADSLNPLSNSSSFDDFGGLYLNSPEETEFN
jgi:hypothetical protein